MKKSVYLIIVSFLLAFTTPSFANELLVLSGETSKNSQRWKDEVYQEYVDSELGKTLPAKIVPVRGKLFPDWMAEAIDEGRVDFIIGTPTFIIWDEKNSKELGRVEGYTEKSRFYTMLNEAVVLVSQGQHPGKREGSGGHEEGSGGDMRQQSPQDDHAREEGSGGDMRSGGEPNMSRDIMDHMYKTPEEAKKASKMLGFGGEIHTHESPNGTIYMPGPQM